MKKGDYSILSPLYVLAFITIPKTNGAGINNTSNRIYGKNSDVYSPAPSGKSFTLAE